jgi:hypothetical protein
VLGPLLRGENFSGLTRVRVLLLVRRVHEGGTLMLLQADSRRWRIWGREDGAAMAWVRFGVGGNKVLLIGSHSWFTHFVVNQWMSIRTALFNQQDSD